MRTICTDHDNKIAQYRRIAVHVTDQLTLDGIANLIKEITAKKADFRCEDLQKK
jgi:hypothetical protein